jgi:hypothetical protein
MFVIFDFVKQTAVTAGSAAAWAAAGASLTLKPCIYKKR